MISYHTHLAHEIIKNFQHFSAFDGVCSQSTSMNFHRQAYQFVDKLTKVIIKSPLLPSGANRKFFGKDPASRRSNCYELANHAALMCRMIITSNSSHNAYTEYRRALLSRVVYALITGSECGEGQVVSECRR